MSNNIEEVDDDTMVSVTGLVRDTGSLLVLVGIDDDGNEIIFGSDRGCGMAILEALDHNEGEDVVALVAPHLVLSRTPFGG